MSRHGNRRLAIPPWKTRVETTSHVSASRPDLHGNLRLPSESLRQRHQGHRLAVQVGPQRGHDTWGTTRSTKGSRFARDDGFQRRVLPPPTHAPIGPVGSPLRPPCHLRSLPIRTDARASLPAPTPFPPMRCGSSRATARPLPPPGSPAARVDFQQRVQRVQRVLTSGERWFQLLTEDG